MKKLLSKKYTTNACALTALCYVSKVDEETILRLCKAHNLDFTQGLTDGQWIKVAKILGLKIRASLKEPVQLGKFMKEYKNDCYLVGTIDHLFVVDNGILFDPRTKRLPGVKRMLLQAWRIIEVPARI